MSEIIKSKYAVMFTDVVDSTKRYSLQGDDKAFDAINRHFDMLKPIVYKFHGRIIKTIGDSIMAAFHKSDEAISAAILMQKVLDDYNNENPQDKIEIRIGVHFGQVNEQDNDLFGDTVNTAARIESLAVGDTIFVSEKINENLTNYKSIYIGDFDVKGKLEPVTVFGILWKPDSKKLLNHYHSTIQSLKQKINRTKTEKNRKLGVVGNTGQVGIMALLEIRTNPAGAIVYINDKKIEQKTPFSIENKVGRIELKIEKTGYRTIVDSFEIFEHLPNKFFSELEDIRGSLYIETESPGYKI
ncbi:MAG: adenylate/guanylate cyclase domain-containing protein, partial [Candidatus Cloacimonadota bacterium]|nr:adenylate/guanylate cyclase domain-containing protein [Candidatus Cloacimonadota bacterium]